jgi:hypothetical protein
MGQRQKLHDKLLTFCPNVYFQRPPADKMVYPCIVYKRDYAVSQFADNNVYRHTKRWMVTVIDRDPDSVIPDRVAFMPLSTFSRFFTADNLNHDIYSVYF